MGEASLIRDRFIIQGHRGVKEGCLGFDGDNTRKHELLYLPVRIRQRMVYCLLDSGATSNFIYEACAHINAERILEDLTLVIELVEGSTLLFKKKDQVWIRVNDWIFRRIMWIVLGLKHATILGKAWLVDFNPQIHYTDHVMCIHREGRLEIKIQGLHVLPSGTPVAEEIEVMSHKEL